LAGAPHSIGQTDFLELRASTIVNVTTTLAALTRTGNDRRCMRSPRNTSSLYVLAVGMTRYAHDAQYDRRVRLADVRCAESIAKLDSVRAPKPPRGTF
jgi:hypothetical protein